MQRLVLDFNNECATKFNKYKRNFRRIYKRTFKMLKLDGSFFVEVNLVNDETIKKINNEYRQKDVVTDVISFAFDDNEDGIIQHRDETPHMLGTILISAPQALRQAAEYGHSAKREFSFLFVHGLLHLLGYDHIAEDDEKEMFHLQDKIIGKRGKKDE